VVKDCSINYDTVKLFLLPTCVEKLSSSIYIYFSLILKKFHMMERLMSMTSNHLSPYGCMFEPCQESHPAVLQNVGGSTTLLRSLLVPEIMRRGEPEVSSFINKAGKLPYVLYCAT
jgi:hypothetical protein